MAPSKGLAQTHRRLAKGLAKPFGFRLRVDEGQCTHWATACVPCIYIKICGMYLFVSILISL
jgi:hypothetical protein